MDNRVLGLRSGRERGIDSRLGRRVPGPPRSVPRRVDEGEELAGFVAGGLGGAREEKEGDGESGHVEGGHVSSGEDASDLKLLLAKDLEGGSL